MAVQFCSSTSWSVWSTFALFVAFVRSLPSQNSGEPSDTRCRRSFDWIQWRRGKKLAKGGLVVLDVGGYTRIWGPKGESQWSSTQILWWVTLWLYPLTRSQWFVQPRPWSERLHQDLGTQRRKPMIVHSNPMVVGGLVVPTGQSQWFVQPKPWSERLHQDLGTQRRKPMKSSTQILCWVLRGIRWTQRQMPVKRSSEPQRVLLK